MSWVLLEDLRRQATDNGHVPAFPGAAEAAVGPAEIPALCSDLTLPCSSCPTPGGLPSAPTEGAPSSPEEGQHLAATRV